MNIFKRPPPKPEFSSVLPDKQVKIGENIVLQCEINSEKINATWEKNDHRLDRVEGKHRTGKKDTMVFLEIRNVEAEDEGLYTVTIENSSGSASCCSMVTVELKEWRIVQSSQEPMISDLKALRVNRGDVSELRFLLLGPIGAGKSSIINTIKSIFEGRQSINCLAATGVTKSFTVKYKKYNVGNVPFAFYDVMGLEDGESQGVHTDDIISALEGHIDNDYTFNSDVSMASDNRYYIRNPTLNDQIHCLVSVIPADKISLIDDRVIRKMKIIRAKATKMGLPQVLFMTKVDQVCKMTHGDLGKIYQSKKIKDKMLECSNRLGITMNCIFPVQNYHERTMSNERLNCLMLQAFTQIVHAANDYVKNCPNEQRE